MLRFVQNWFAPRVNPIGVDFGTDCLRLAQVQLVEGEYRLIAAASTDVPSHVRQNAPARLEFFVEALRDMLIQGNFRSRQAVLALPASLMSILHLRMAKMDDAETRKALPWEARGKLPIDPSQALIRHLIAGEVYQEQETRNEVIVMAASREIVHQLLSSASKGKLDVIGMNVEPRAILDCITYVYRRKSDADATTCFVDIGCSASRAFIARGRQIMFARVIPVGGDQFNKATSAALKISFEEAKLLRIKICAATSAPAERAGEPAAPTPEPGIDNEFPVLGAMLQAKSAAFPAPVDPQSSAASTSPLRAPMATPLADLARQVEQACQQPLRTLISELDLCRRYFESTFPNAPVERLVFIGGEARHRSLCQQVARELGLAAQLGDPMARLARTSEVAIESGIDRRLPQPSWTVAIGLSLGPVAAPAASTAPGAS